jgi:hypothetical protein
MCEKVGAVHYLVYLIPLQMSHFILHLKGHFCLYQVIRQLATELEIHETEQKTAKIHYTF